MVFKFYDLIDVMRVSMAKEIAIQHVAVECSDQQSADCFFTTILGIPKIKNTILSKKLSAAIFGINKSVFIEIYDNGKIRFEVFINPTRNEPTYDHICIEVNNKSDFITQCKQQGLNPFFIEKEGKQLLFVRDFSNNLFEVLEKDGKRIKKRDNEVKDSTYNNDKV
jgi:catechol 2,3-dioxygenase-like lactoylglutathione lyase family enzyme